MAVLLTKLRLNRMVNQFIEGGEQDVRWCFRPFHPLGSCVLDYLCTVLPACSRWLRKNLYNNLLRKEQTKKSLMLYGGFF